jgi:hypothetical protein
MAKDDFKEHWASVRSGLLDLRHLFDLNPDGDASVVYFDESLEANELEIALHVLCDCVLTASTIRITDTEIEKVDLLHCEMRLEDECVSSIRRRAGQMGK